MVRNKKNNYKGNSKSQFPKSQINPKSQCFKFQTPNACFKNWNLDYWILFGICQANAGLEFGILQSKCCVRSWKLNKLNQLIITQMPKPILFSGRSNLPLAQKVAKELKIKLGRVEIKNFSDGETYVDMEEDVQDQEVYIMQSGSYHADKNLMELLLIVEIARELGAKKITAILPFYPYRRQERRLQKGEPITAKLVAKLLEAAGVSEAILVELHSSVIKSFFQIPFVYLRTGDLFVDYFKKYSKNAVVVSADSGAKGRSGYLAENLKVPLVLMTKDRQTKHDSIAKMTILGEVAGKDILILEDEINTGGTLALCSKILKEKGAGDIYVGATHAVLSGSYKERLSEAPIKEIIFTDTINVPEEKKLANMKFISAAGLIADIIKQRL